MPPTHHRNPRTDHRKIEHQAAQWWRHFYCHGREESDGRVDRIASRIIKRNFHKGHVARTAVRKHDTHTNHGGYVAETTYSIRELDTTAKNATSATTHSASCSLQHSENRACTVSFQPHWQRSIRSECNRCRCKGTTYNVNSH